MTAELQIKGSVARVLSARELVINRGSADGVELGMKFNILDQNGLSITDPETGEVLGSVHRPKVQVVVTQVETHLSVARTFKYEVNFVAADTGDLVGIGPIAKLFAPRRLVRQYETFRTEDAPWEEIDETQSYVKPGDPVEQVVVIEGEPTGPTVRSFERSAGSSGQARAGAQAGAVGAARPSAEGRSSS